MPTYYVYMLTTRNNTALYTGVTNNMQRRLYEHKNKLLDGFTKKYNISKLVYFETYSEIKYAIAREKEIKGWTRAKKNALVASSNPEWQDLSSGFEK